MRSLGNLWLKLVESLLSAQPSMMTITFGEDIDGPFLLTQSRGISGFFGVVKIKTQKVNYTILHTPLGMRVFCFSSL
jgi:hypothetical protein